ncbi:MAG: tRNA-dihydrouridine synthase [Spirochaetota bacterium]
MTSPTPRERVLAILGGNHAAFRGASVAAASAASTPLLLAPMASLTHAGLRTLIAEFGGCDLYLTEMINAEALVGGTPYETYYLDETPGGERLVFQLMGYSERAIMAAAEELMKSGCAGIDFNMGCSAPHIVRKGGGIAWMRERARTANLVRALRSVVTDRALSVKLRLGREDDPEALLDLASALVDAGVDYLTLHPKRQREGSARRARWSYVRMLREHLPVPVVGNGGVVGYESLVSRTAEAGPGPVMIGRAAARAPWIFAYLRRRLAGDAGEYRVGLKAVAERFFTLLEEYQPRDFWPSRARRFLPYLMANLTFGHTLAARLAQMNSYDQARGEVMAYFDAHPENATYAERG